MGYRKPLARCLALEKQNLSLFMHGVSPFICPSPVTIEAVTGPSPLKKKKNHQRPRQYALNSSIKKISVQQNSAETQLDETTGGIWLPGKRWCPRPCHPSPALPRQGRAWGPQHRPREGAALPRRGGQRSAPVSPCIWVFTTARPQRPLFLHTICFAPDHERS